MRPAISAPRWHRCAPALRLARELLVNRQRYRRIREVTALARDDAV